jgi:hypothetical protein
MAETETRKLTAGPAKSAPLATIKHMTQIKPNRYYENAMDANNV